MSAHDDLIESLFAVGEEKLPEALEAQILAAGPEIVPRLEALLDDETLMREDGRGDGWVPLFALKLLGKMQATTSIPRIIQLLAGSDPLDYSWSYAIKALDNMGAPALEPLLKAYALTDNDDDVDAHVAMASALAEIHVRDERRFQLLLERCREPEDTLVVDIIGLAEYGDARALPTLTGLLDRTFSSGDDHIDLDRDEIIEACQAIEELGGTLTPAQQTLRDGARRIRHSGAAHVPVRKEVKPGRNEPCWCGSGAKYKRCHLAADEAKRRA